jgi:drug/metabolite transporter (DMT)-like permease
MVQQFRQDSTGRAVALLLLGVVGGLGLDLCAKGLLATGAMFGFFYGLARMPLVDALTLGFTAPLMVTALSVPMLGEHVGWRRWIAVSVGFAGVLIILRPGGGDISFASIAVLFAAFCYACMAITARKLATTE